MYGKRYTRSGVFTWTPQPLEEHGLIVADYAQHFDPLNAPGEAKLEWVPISSMYEGSVIQPKVSVKTEYRANSLAWTGLRTDDRPMGLCVAGCENGTVVFFDPNQLIKNSRIDIISSRRDHQGHVLSVDVSVDQKWAMSGGGQGQLLLWDTNNPGQPFSPGQPSFTDQVKCVRWNRSMDNIVASLSSHRCSLWDLRRPGGPIMDLGEVGGGCDWAELCWSPTESTALLTASQSDSVPLLYKWDLRYPTAPVRDHRIHGKGVTSIDWSGADPRLLLSASHDHQVVLSNPETGEVHGTIGCEQDDWIRNVSWCLGKPDLIAIQYFQHPIQITNLQSFGTSEPSQEQACAHLGVELNVIPAWVSAAPVGARFSLGCRMATHARYWDETTKQWSYRVEIKRIEPNPEIYSTAMDLQDACDGNQLAGYCEDKAHATEDRKLQNVWMFLTVAASGNSRSKYLRMLGFDNNTATASTSNPTTTSASTHATTNTSSEISAITDRMRNVGTRSRSVVSDSSDDDDSHELPAINFGKIDSTDWNTLGHMVTGDDESVLASLLASKNYVVAILYFKDRPAVLKMILLKYLEDPIQPSERLLISVVAGLFNPLVYREHTLPQDNWRHVVAAILSKSRDNVQMVNTMKVLAEQWANDPSTWHQAAICSVLAQDASGFLHSIKNRPLEERVSMTLALARSLRSRCAGAEWEEVLGNYVGMLVDNGCLDVAWRLLNELDTQNTALLSLRYALWEACGGKERTQCGAPSNIDQNIQKHYASVLRPKDQLPNVARRVSQPYNPQQNGYGHTNPSQITSPYGAPPSQTFGAPPPIAPPSTQNGYGIQASQQYGAAVSASSQYGVPPMGMQTSSSQMAPPPLGPPPMGNSVQQPVAPTPVAPPIVSGYMQPAQASPMSAAPSVNAQASPISDTVSVQPKSSAPGWNDPPPLPSKKTESRPTSVMQVTWKPLDVPAPGAMGMGYHQGAMSLPPQNLPPTQPVEQPKIELAPEDQGIFDKFMQLGDAILASNRSPVMISKVEELKARLEKELAGRLAQGRLSQDTRALLWHAGDAASRGDIRTAQNHASHMVRTGADFVEVSAFLPALKSLFAQAATTFHR